MAASSAPRTDRPPTDDRAGSVLVVLRSARDRPPPCGAAGGRRGCRAPERSL